MYVHPFSCMVRPLHPNPVKPGFLDEQNIILRVGLQ
jgi:hypothetical protein